jgi:hypothetical protein
VVRDDPAASLSFSGVVVEVWPPGCLDPVLLGLAVSAAGLASDGGLAVEAGSE